MLISRPLSPFRARSLLLVCLAAATALLAGCNRGSKEAKQVTVYCGVDEPYAGKIFAEFERQTGIHVNPLYDIESSKSVGLSEKIRAERDHPQADVWWGSEAFLTVRMAGDGVLAEYRPPGAADVPAEYKDAQGLWTGVGLRARVLAIGDTPLPFPVKSILDLTDPRLKGKITISRPTAGATGAHVAALYVFWGPEKARDYFRKLHDNGCVMVGGNAVVADQVGAGSFAVGLTDSDDVSNTAANGVKISAILPDQDTFGTLAMPTTVALVKGAHHPDAARRLIDYLVSKQVEQELITMNFAHWSVRGTGQPLKAMPVDYPACAKIYGQAQREAIAILEGHGP
jgi:iron(III) transport system substrate-binding protein